MRAQVYRPIGTSIPPEAKAPVPSEFHNQKTTPSLPT
jgi:hypothetical protein